MAGTFSGSDDDHLGALEGLLDQALASDAVVMADAVGEVSRCHNMRQ
jgi:hypothetical protein